MYKNYNMFQLTLPIETEMSFPENDIVFIINKLVESVPQEAFNPYYSQRGPSSYHPKMMLKIILYSYAHSVFSGRRIEHLLKDSCRMMWLAQGQTPTYRTINRFRVNPHMMEFLHILFVGLRAQLLEDKLITEDVIYIDGTKIEANANKYTFQWLANTKRFSQSVIEKSTALYEQLVSEEIIPEIKRESGHELTSEELNQIETHLGHKNDALTSEIETTQDVETRKTLRKERSKVRQSKKAIQDFKDRKIKYDKQMEIYGDRKSYSKTDHDATFMRMKDDHMRNGQLKPGYNLQIATHNQFVLAFGVYSYPGDTRTLEPFLKSIHNLYGDIPEYIVADAGYGSEYNYTMILDEFEKTPLITYSMYLKEKQRKYKNNPFITANWEYREIDDYYICPNKKELHFQSYRKKRDGYGIQRDFKLYACEACVGCPLRSQCMKQSTNPNTNKRLFKNLTWDYFKAFTNQQLSDPKTKHIYQKRKIDVESTFGNLKANLGFQRLSVRTKSKVECELGIALMAVNIRKLAKISVRFRSLIRKKPSNSKKMNFDVFFLKELKSMSQPLFVYGRRMLWEVSLTYISYINHNDTYRLNEIEIKKSLYKMVEFFDEVSSLVALNLMFKFDKSDFEKLSQLKELYSDLGYPVIEDKLENRLNSIYRHNDYYILLLIKDDKIIGFSGMCKMYFYEYDGEYMRILAFVVSSKYRKRGYGKLLLNKSEELASSLNCKAITLNSGITMDRKSAHNFYKRNGYNNGTLGFSKLITKSL